MSALIHLTDNQFESETAAGLCLLDFSATWCGPCRGMLPIVEALADTYAGKVKICKVDIEESPNLAQRFHIRTVPTFILLQDGAVTQEWIGAQDKSVFESALDELL